ncbi:hypothetical protein [Saccharomonospora saliphila]|uniref:hypothetical protein n=1 Tax=Saccharomonospora saliphila TaxID=369829 RepID=UPI000372AEA2|nr:hypothetical protein [Saccharomonospora saliphila]
MSVELDTAPQRDSRVDYRATFGWPVEGRTGRERLVTGAGIGAVVVPRGISGVVLASLDRQGCGAPVLTLPTRREMATVFLVETGDVGVVETGLPPGVHVLPAGSVVPLPDERDPEALTRWVVEPDVSRRWLPSLGAVLATVVAIASPRGDLPVW